MEGVILAESLKDKIRDREFNEELENYLALMDPVCKLINSCQSPTLSVADSTQFWLQLKEKINQRRYDSDIESRVEKAVSEVGYAANYLHPKYQGRLLDENKKQKALDFLINNLNEEGVIELTRFHFNHRKFRGFVEKCESALSFWHLVSPWLPELHKVAVKLMVIPASTALIEDLFSQWKFVHSPYRNKLGYNRSCKLIDTYHTIKKLGEVPI